MQILIYVIYLAVFCHPHFPALRELLFRLSEDHEKRERRVEDEEWVHNCMTGRNTQHKGLEIIEISSNADVNKNE